MKIMPNQVFLDGEDRYEKDQAYDVPLEKGIYFCGNGWADSAEVTSLPQPEIVDLDIHNSSVSLKDSNG